MAKEPTGGLSLQSPELRARELERSELSALRHFPRSLRQWDNALRLLRSHGARVDSEGGAVELVEHEEEPVADEVAEFGQLLAVALAAGKETESGIKCIRRRVEGARHAFPLGWFIEELGFDLAADATAAARIGSEKGEYMLAENLRNSGDGLDKQLIAPKV